MTVKHDIGYIEPKGYQTIPIQTIPIKHFEPKRETKDWLDKVGQYAGKLWQGLYIGAMGALDIYGRYKAIERGVSDFKLSQDEKPVIQEIDKKYIFLGLIIATVVLIILIKK